MTNRIAFVGGGNMATGLIGGLIARGTPPADDRGGRSGGLAALAPRARLRRSDGGRCASGRRRCPHGRPRRQATADGAGRPLDRRTGERCASARHFSGRRHPVAGPGALARPGRTADPHDAESTRADRCRHHGAVCRARSRRDVAPDSRDDPGRLRPDGLGARRSAARRRHRRVRQWPGVLLPVDRMPRSPPASSLDSIQTTARKLAVETARGSGRMAAEAAESPAELRAQVTSKGGTTAAALEVLEAAGVRGIFAAAVAAAARRSTELAQEFGTL